MHRTTKRLAAFAVALLATCLALPAAQASPGSPVDVQVLSITDFHGYLQPPSPSAGDGGTIPDGNGGRLTVGGAAYLATHLKSLRKRNSVFLAAGDSFAGWPFEVDAFRDEPTIEVLNKLGLDLAAAGNHELDVSPSFLKDHMLKGRCFDKVNVDSCFTDSTGRRFRGARFPILSANIAEKDTGRLLLKPYVIKRFRGVPVGFINLTVKDMETGSTSYQPELTTLDEIETANKYAAELKRKGVNAIVVNMHDGGSAGGVFNKCSNPSGPAFDLARKASPDIDAIVTGHWHARFNCSVPDPAGNPRPVVEPGNHGQLINEINLKIDRRTRDVIRARTTSVDHPVTRDVTPDPEVQRIADHWTARGVRRYAEPVARQTGDFTRTPNEHGESTMGDLAADVHYWEAAKSRRGRPDLALIATRPVRGSTALRGDLPFAKGGNAGDADGRVLFGESWDAYGYGNPILTVTVTGEQIHQTLEQQWQGTAFAPLGVSKNVRYSYDASRPIGDRVDPKDVLINGKALDPARKYRLAALAYTLIGDDGYPALNGFTQAHRNYLPDHEAFVAYLKAHRKISPAPLDRVTARR